ncbi:hypothetical protein [Streptomyces sp. CBG33]|uniref:hypothetical protein n=1 Tax=Streptomyces sp. CBG33 TaxID=2762624 RepID=UPI0021BDD26C|nr:hypothetical protein [Streptomyces sp. CBG33]
MADDGADAAVADTGLEDQFLAFGATAREETGAVTGVLPALVEQPRPGHGPVDGGAFGLGQLGPDGGVVEEGEAALAGVDPAVQGQEERGASLAVGTDERVEDLLARRVVEQLTGDEVAQDDVERGAPEGDLAVPLGQFVDLAEEQGDALGRHGLADRGEDVLVGGEAAGALDQGDDRLATGDGFGRAAQGGGHPGRRVQVPQAVFLGEGGELGDAEPGPVLLGGVGAAQFTAGVEFQQVEAGAVVVGVGPGVQDGRLHRAPAHQLGEPVVHADGRAVGAQVPAVEAGRQRGHEGEEGTEVVGELLGLRPVGEERAVQEHLAERLGVDGRKAEFPRGIPQRRFRLGAPVDIASGDSVDHEHPPERTATFRPGGLPGRGRVLYAERR